MLLNDFGGDWDAYVNAVHAEFRRLYIDAPPTCGALPFSVKKRPVSEGREPSFWHLVSEGKTEDERLPELRRSERIRYPRALIDAASVNDPDVRCWKQDRGREGKRIILATTDFDYMTVLGLNENYVILLTGFPVEREHRQKKIRQEWEAGRLATPW